METNLPNWNALPLDILASIFSYLRMNDRSNAAAVCKTWNRAFHSPLLWRSMICYFSDTPMFGEGPYLVHRNSIGAVKHFSSWIRHLEIIWEPNIIPNRRDNATLRAAEFFRILSSGSKAPQLKILMLVGYEEESEDEDLDELILAITSFLHTQTHLKLFYVDWKLKTLHGILLLDALNSSCSQCLISLWLEDCFSHQQIRCPNILNKYINRCCHLRELDLAYENLGKETLWTLATNCRNTLIRLRITCDVEFLRSVSQLHSIPSEVWKNVQEILPKLRVNFYLGYAKWRIDILRGILVIGMPLSHLTIQMASPEKSIIQYLSVFSETLEQVVFDAVADNNNLPLMSSTKSDISLETSIAALTICCSNLKQLFLFGTFSLEIVSMICKLRSQNQIGLKSLGAIFHSLTPNDESHLQRLKEHYSHLDSLQLHLFSNNSHEINTNQFGNHVFEDIDGNFFNDNF